MNGRKDRVEAIFQAAMELNSPGEREAYLLDECAEDVELRREVQELLRAAVEAEEVFESRPHQPALERAGSRIGNYHLLQKIGEGGCGVVYVAEQQEPIRRRVALKLIKLGMDTRQVIARFESERQALALMDHSNIARVLDAGASETGRPFFVMELVRGVKITDYCDQYQLSTTERLELFVPVCRAVQHAHLKGIIHRDLKPSNILVTVNDDVAVPKVIDFGIAKATEGRLTHKTVYTELHQFIGTPAYMSPEQAEMTSVDIDTRSDVYSLGVLLYELLTGKTPFGHQELMKIGLDAMRQTIRNKEPLRPSTRLSKLAATELSAVAKARRSEPPKLINTVRGDLDWIVMKALEKDRARRYETANGLARDVEWYLSNEPISARPPSRLYRFHKLVKRNKLAFAAAAAAVAFLMVGFAVSTFLFLREREARKQAVTAEQAEKRARLQAEVSGNLASAGLAFFKQDFVKAQQIMSRIPSSALRTYMESNPSPNAWQALSLLGGWHAARQEWRAAISAYGQAAVFSRTNFPLLNQGASCQGLAALLVQAGDLEAYRQLCRTIIAGSAGTIDPNVADRAAKACLILPDSGIDLAAVSKLVNTAVSSGATLLQGDYFVATKGWLEYRQGRFADAVDSTRQSLVAETSMEDGCRVEAYMVLAMSQQCLKNTNDAAEALVNGRSLAQTMPEPAFGGRGFWVDWIISRSLMSEATTLIEGSAKGKAALNQRKGAQ